MRACANRSFLFAPADHPRRTEKAFALGADAVILDLEDAVALAEKPAAREAARAALARPRPCAAYVRVNAHDTEFCYADIEALVSPDLDGIVLPKLESVAQLECVDWLLANLERARGLAAGAIDLVPIVETARGAAAIRELATAGSRVRRLAFGAGDYTADLGIDWSLAEEELLPIRSEFVLASRLGRLEPPVDTVFIHIREAAAFRASCERGRALGFQGKLCIHPDQVGPANAAFAPGAGEEARAARIVAAFEAAEAGGVASIQVDGYFVDYPIYEKARRVLETANRIRAAAPPA